VREAFASTGGHGYSFQCTTEDGTDQVTGECECSVTDEATDILMFESLSSFLDALLPPYPQTMVDTLESPTHGQADFFDTLFGTDAEWTTSTETTTDKRGRPCGGARTHAQDGAVSLEDFLDSARVDALRTQNGYEAMRPVAIVVETQEYELPPWRQHWPKKSGPLATPYGGGSGVDHLLTSEERHEVCLARAALALLLALCLTTLLWCCTCQRRSRAERAVATSSPLYDPLFDAEGGYDSDSAESSGESPLLQEVMCVNPLFRGQTPPRE